MSDVVLPRTRICPSLRMLIGGLVCLAVLAQPDFSEHAHASATDKTRTTVIPPPELLEGKGCRLPSQSPLLPGATKRMPLPDERQHAYDVIHYDNMFYIDPSIVMVVGSTAITFTALVGDLDEIVLDFFDNMDIIGAYKVGIPYIELPYTRGDDRLILTLPEPMALGETAMLILYFNGQPEFYGFLGFQFGETPAGRNIAASLSQPWSARSWWPCKDIPPDKATFTATLHVPIGMTGVSNGVLIEDTAKRQEIGPPGWQEHSDWLNLLAAHGHAKNTTESFVWYEYHPISTYHFSVAATTYEILEDSVATIDGNVPVTHYVYPELVEPASSDFAVLPEMIDFCVSRFGPYPFPGEKYGMALFEWDGAMEHPTCTSYGSHLVTGDGFFETIIIHELAHMWFGNLVTCQDWTHTWLNEGFATYVEALWAEQRYGNQALHDFMNARSDFTWWDEPLVRDPDEPDPWYYFHNMVYYKGAWVLHMLRHYLGDWLFFRCLNDYLTAPEHHYGTATSQDFVDVCSNLIGVDLNWFFDQWLYWSVHPRYEVDWVNATPAPGQVTITIRQVQDPDPVHGDLPFQMPIDLRLMGVGMDTLITVFNDQREKQYVIALPAGVAQIELDPGNWLLQRSEMVVTDLGESPPPGSPVRLLPPTPNPFNPRCRIRWESDLPSRDLLNLYDLQGHRIASISYPRQAPGRRQYVWDGRDQQGRPCATGVYLYDVTCHLDGAAPGKQAVPAAVVQDNADSKPAAGRSASVDQWRLTGKITLSR